MVAPSANATMASVSARQLRRKLKIMFSEVFCDSSAANVTRRGLTPGNLVELRPLYEAGRIFSFEMKKSIYVVYSLSVHCTKANIVHSCPPVRRSRRKVTVAVFWWFPISIVEEAKTGLLFLLRRPERTREHSIRSLVLCVACNEWSGVDRSPRHGLYAVSIHFRNDLNFFERLLTPRNCFAARFDRLYTLRMSQGAGLVSATKLSWLSMCPFQTRHRSSFRFRTLTREVSFQYEIFGLYLGNV